MPLAIGQRTDGRIRFDRLGRRLNRHAAARLRARLARRADIPRPVSPQTMRDAAITAALDAGCSLRDVQDYSRVSWRRRAAA